MDNLTEANLIALLKKHQIDTSIWIKPVSSLLQEIKNGECTLEEVDSTLIRRVDVVRVYCYHVKEGRRWQLYEEKQIFKNGRQRARGFDYVAEKMQQNETPIDAAYRGVREELGITLAALDVGGRDCERANSSTYNGISCIYNRYNFSAYISEADYRDGYIEVQDDKSTYFKWK